MNEKLQLFTFISLSTSALLSECALNVRVTVLSATLIFMNSIFVYNYYYYRLVFVVFVCWWVNGGIHKPFGCLLSSFSAFNCSLYVGVTTGCAMQSPALLLRLFRPYIRDRHTKKDKKN